MTEAWVTLATTDGYAVGALVLAQSLKASNTTRKLHCMVTNAVSQPLLEELRSVYDAVTTVNVFDSGDSVNLGLIGRPDLGVTFTKIHCWRLTQYTKCVFLDADCLVLQNSDELFERPEFSAVADIGWPDCFNSGVFVFIPSEHTYGEILRFALEHGSFDGGDQGLLNMYYSDWRDKPPQYRLPFIYNMTAGAIYSYAAAYKRFGAQVKIVHFLGAVKPWQESGGHHISEHLAYWWSLFSTRVAPSLPSTHVSWSCSLPLCKQPSSSSIGVRDFDPSSSFSIEMAHLDACEHVDSMCATITPVPAAAPIAIETDADAGLDIGRPSGEINVEGNDADNQQLSEPSEEIDVERNDADILQLSEPSEEVDVERNDADIQQLSEPSEEIDVERNDADIQQLSEPSEEIDVERNNADNQQLSDPSEEIVAERSDADNQLLSQPLEEIVAERSDADNELLSRKELDLERKERTVGSPRSSAPDRSSGSCMRVFRCIPPVYQTWTPLRFIPKHLANQMAAFLPVPGAQQGDEPGPTDEERMKAWEIGHPDYLGRDAFANIQKAIDEALH
uniref:glycogenin glucosyltransferase n=1 Tax=Parascaris univalens TaxID=6257 RepID=A0A915A7R9_PARUN